MSISDLFLLISSRTAVLSLSLSFSFGITSWYRFSHYKIIYYVKLLVKLFRIYHLFYHVSLWLYEFLFPDTYASLDVNNNTLLLWEVWSSRYGSYDDYSLQGCDSAILVDRYWYYGETCCLKSQKSNMF